MSSAGKLNNFMSAKKRGEGSETCKENNRIVDIQRCKIADEVADDAKP